MASRLEKYQDEVQSTRSSRNARLYKEVYGKYGDMDNLPIEDNTNEIDMESLKELVLNSNRKKEVRDYSDLNILENKPRKIDESRVYDINKMLEKAKYENSKLKEPISHTSKINKRILSTLENDDISLDDIKRETNNIVDRNIRKDRDEDLSMTRELKFKNLAKDNEKNMKTSDLSLEMFSDLKPSGNTIVTKPIKDTSEFTNTKTNSSSFIKPLVDTKGVTEEDFLSTDTSDIDVIKETPKNGIDKDFFTSSYEFSKKDFTPDDEFDDDEKGSGLIKVILLFLFIAVLIGVIIYFILNYGIGA